MDWNSKMYDIDKSRGQFSNRIIPAIIHLNLIPLAIAEME